MNDARERARASLRANWPVLLGLLIGAEGFVLGTIENRSALAPLWGLTSWAWIGVLALVALVAAILQGKLRWPMPFVLAVGCALVITAFGVGPFAVVTLIAVSCYAIGARILEWVEGTPPGSAAADIFLATTIGLAACSLLLGFAAHARINVPAAYLGLSVVAIWLGRRHVLTRWRWIAAILRDERRGDTPLLLRAALWFAFGFQACFAALPERYFDALAVHLLVARQLDLFGLWHFDPREYVLAVQPMGANWLFGWAYVLAGEYAAKLQNALFLLLMCGVIVESRTVSRRLGLFAAAILALTPLTFVVTASLFVDAALALFITAAFVFAARIRDLPHSASVAGFAIASAGAMGVKPHGLVAFGGACIALLIVGGWREVLRAGSRTRIACLLAAIAAAWPYVYAWRATGNPVFPYFNGIFKSPLFPILNFTNFLYPGGLQATDFYDLAFSASNYMEGYDGATGFALTLLLPAGLLVAAVVGSTKIRVIAVATLLYALLVLINTRYLRYLFPAFPLLALLLVYPLSVARSAPVRGVYLAIAIAAMAIGVFRIPAAGWILQTFDPMISFSEGAKEALLDAQVPMRRLGRIQAAVANNDARVVMFGQNVGADIRGRPVYVSWYFPRLQDMVFDNATPEAAANALAALDASYVMFDRRDSMKEWAAWETAAQRYGRMIESNDAGVLYEFHADAVPGKGLFPDTEEPWHGWALSPAQAEAVTGDSMILPPGSAASRPADLKDVPAGAEIILSVEHVCAQPSKIRLQANWLKADGSFIRVDAIQSYCGNPATRGSLRVTPPKEARAVYFYFTNDGEASARLFGERESVLVKP
jgi:hypothetical protein